MVLISRILVYIYQKSTDCLDICTIDTDGEFKVNYQISRYPDSARFGGAERKEPRYNRIRR